MTVEYSRFPARVLVSDGRLLDPVAVVVVGSRVQVAEKRGNTAVVVLDRGDVTASVRQPDRSQLVTLADGSTLRIGKGAGCGCRSPLKAWYSAELREAR